MVFRHSHLEFIHLMYLTVYFWINKTLNEKEEWFQVINLLMLNSERSSWHILIKRI